MKKAWILIVVTIVFLIIIAGVAKADDYVINEYVEQDVMEYHELTGLIVGAVVIIIIHAVVCDLIAEYANEAPPYPSVENGN